MTQPYKKLIPVELHDKLKAGEIGEIKKTNEVVMFLLITSALSGIAWAVTLIAWLVWMNKFTLFTLGSFSVIFAFVFMFSVWQIKVHAKDIKKLIETLKERE